jgi:hypothetical protein
MPLILAIEPDPRQAAQIAAIARNRVGAELMLADTTVGALDIIGDRVPDLVLVPALLSPQDDAALAAALRVIAAAAHVRTLTIPVLSAGPKRARVVGMLAKWRRGKSESPEPDGCDPAIFAEQISVYLKEAAAERAALEAAAATDEPALEAAHAVYAKETTHPVYAEATPQAVYVEEAPGAVYVEETPQAAYVEEAPRAIYVEETPQAAYVEEAPRAVYVEATPQATSVLETPHAGGEREPQAASGIIAPVVSVEKPSTVFEEPKFFVEEPPPAPEETRVVSAQPVPVEQELTLASPAPDKPLAVEEPLPTVALKGATGRKGRLAETRAPQAEEELVFELTLDDTDVMFFNEPAPIRRQAPTVKAIASPPIAREVFTAANERVPRETVSINDQRGEDLATIQEFSAELTTPDRRHAHKDPVTADPPRRAEHWMPMSSGIERLWPPLEGVLAEFADALDLLDQADVRTAAADVEAIDIRHDARADKVVHEASTVPSRATVQPKPPTHPAAAPPAAVPLTAVPLTAVPPLAQSLSPVTPLSAAPHPPPATVDTPKSEWVELIDSLRQDIERLRSTPPQPVPSPAVQPVEAAVVAVPPDDVVPAPQPKRRAKTPHPVQDEWGFFDPEQCGFAALLAKLDEMTESSDEPESHAN